METAVTLDTQRLVLAAVIGLALLLVLIIKFKIHAMLSILIGAVTIGLIAGMPFEEIVSAVDDGMANTLKGIALLVGLGSMFGAILEISGGAQTLAVTMVKRFGDEKAAWALGITGLVIAMPEIAGLSQMYLACVVAAVAGGATVCSHFNDSGFWLVRSLIGVDEKTTLKTWTIMETLVGGTGFLVALVISFFV